MLVRLDNVAQSADIERLQLCVRSAATLSFFGLVHKIITCLLLHLMDIAWAQPSAPTVHFQRDLTLDFH